MKQASSKHEYCGKRTDFCSMVSRRELLKYSVVSGATLAVGGLMAGAIQAAEAGSSSSQPVVQTTAGKIRGYTAGGVNIFKGVPYGASTAGENRFIPPKRPVAWAGVRDALHYGPMATQSPVTDKIYLRVMHGLYPTLPFPMSEDSLVLNVWSSELGDGDKRPVMVWLHPGGFVVGAGNSDWSDGTNLARKHDVVMVSVNHRLGVFGHLYLGEIGGAKYAESGNVGMLDIVAALEWVQDNIARFGGDPSNVTIFGESGGAGKVSVLMAMPQAKGLFHKAIVQDSSMNRAGLPEEAAKSAAEVLARLKIGSNEIDKLHQVPPDRILKASKGKGFLPVVAGASLPRHPFDPDAPPISAEVPMLIGTNKDVGTYFSFMSPTPHVYDETTLRHAVVNYMKWYGVVDDDRAEMFIKAYRTSHPAASLSDCLYGIGTDIVIDDADIQAERKASQSGAPMYMYLFAWESPAFDGKYGAGHTFEIPFVFDNVDAAPQLWGPNPDLRRYTLAANLSTAWAAFAHSGDPNQPQLPQWKPFTVTERETMLLKYSCELVRDPRRDARLAVEPLRKSRMP